MREALRQLQHGCNLQQEGSWRTCSLWYPRRSLNGTTVGPRPSSISNSIVRQRTRLSASRMKRRHSSADSSEPSMTEQQPSRFDSGVAPGSTSQPDPVRGRARGLMWHGMMLFVLGLLTGLVQNQLSNPRMGLSAHLEGIMNGTFLLALGAAWPSIRLSARNATWAYRAALLGTYGNWGVTLVAALLGTSAMTPIAADGHSAERWQEAAITVGFVVIGVAVLLASVLLLLGFRRER